MPYLTENKLSSIIDLPVCIPATEVQQGDWLIVASVKLLAPHRLRYRFCNMQLHSSTVDVGAIETGNLTYGNLGLAYLVLRRDYLTGSPGTGGAADTLFVTDLGIQSRDTDNELLLTTPGTYSWILANNCKANSATAIPASTPINLRISVTGQVRMELNAV